MLIIEANLRDTRLLTKAKSKYLMPKAVFYAG